MWYFICRNHFGMLCVKFGWNWSSWSGVKFFKNFIKELSQFHYHLPLERERNLNPIQGGMLCASLVEIGPVVLEKILQTNDRQLGKPTWAFSSGELKTKTIEFSSNFQILNKYPVFPKANNKNRPCRINIKQKWLILAFHRHQRFSQKLWD